MKKLILLDIDETLEISSGPIKLMDLYEFKKEHPLVSFGLCGNWALVTTRVPWWRTLFDFVSIACISKSEYMRQIKRYFNFDSYIYVGNEFPSTSNISDRDEAEKAGWFFIEAKDFKFEKVIEK